MSVLTAIHTTGGWMSEPPLGVYIHIPFCSHRCHYCDFNTYEGLEEIHLPYARSLVRSIEAWRETWGTAPFDGLAPPEGPAATLFIGGGTPTLLPPDVLGEIIDAVKRSVGLTSDAEVTIEANPETIDPPMLRGLLDAGCNRLSMGLQSTSSEVLRGLGRTHTAERGLRAIEMARAAGFESVNADLIYGSVWEDDDKWERSLRDVLSSGPDHVSAYALTVEEGTPLQKMVGHGRVPDVDPDVQARRWETAVRVLGEAGFERYEVSNWARPDRACRHNLIYWSAGDYLAFGAGAHGHRSGLRWWLHRLPRDLIAAVGEGSAGVAGTERLAPQQRAREALMLGLRVAGGVDREGFSRRFGDAIWAEADPVIHEMEKLGLIISEGNRIRISGGATLVSDDLLSRLP